MLTRRLFTSSTASYSLHPNCAIIASLVLQRNPIVMKPLNEVEQEYSKFREMVDAERSSGIFHVPSSNDTGAKSNASMVTEVQMLKAEPDSKIDNDTQDPRRHLHRKLYFVVKNELGGGRWTFPSLRFNERIEEDRGEQGLHEHALRAAKEILSPSSSLELYQVGKSPVAFLHEKYTDRLAAPFSAKHFFFRSHCIAGKIGVNGVEDHAWLLKEELKHALDDEYYAAVEPVLSE